MAEGAIRKYEGITFGDYRGRCATRRVVVSTTLARRMKIERPELKIKVRKLILKVCTTSVRRFRGCMMVVSSRH
jgi:hypothetical protein